MKENPELFIGFITYGEYAIKYLPFFLESLRDQIYQNFEIIALDNSEKNNNEKQNFIRQNYPEIKLEWSGGNIGFGRGFNRLINKSIKTGAKYFLAVNTDMIFEPEMIEELVKAIKKDEKIGAVQPKILRWDFTNKQKTKTIDSLGLTMTEDFCFFDNMQGEDDYETAVTADQKIMGFTGAAVLFRLEALKDIAFNNNGRLEYFDELMFMYKEDCDLSIRLRLAGWEIMLAPNAIAFHDRTASTKGKSIGQIIANRKNKSKFIKKLSFFNHWVMIIKFWNLFPSRIKINIIWFQLKSFIFIVLFEQYLILEFFKIIRAKKEIIKKRKKLKIEINFNDLMK
jgi:GT2 family glycosyltransferase